MQRDWISCDGKGHSPDGPRSGAATQYPIPDTRYPTPAVSRRSLLFGTALAAVGWAAREATALADVTVDPHSEGHDKDILVNIFLRGGADGLNIVVPHGEDAYHRKRPVV